MAKIAPPALPDAAANTGDKPRLQLPSLDTFKGTPLDGVIGWNHWLGLIIAVFSALTAVAIVKNVIEDRARKGAESSTAGLNYVIGPMGSGKSMFGVRAIVAALLADRYVITNCRLLPGWAEQVVRKKWPRVARNPAELERAVARLEARYIYETSLRTAMRYRVPCAVCGGKVKECGHIGPFQEGRAVFVWDETHNDLNNRDYAGHGNTAAERELEKERRRIVIRWATQLRKLGFSGYLLSQHHENTDAQLRRVCNHLIRLQNQRNSEGGWIAKLLPRRLTLFLVYWYPAHLAAGTPEHMIQPVRRERYWLPWTRHLFDSWDTFHGIDDLDGEDAPIQLPGLQPAETAKRARGLGKSARAGGPGFAGDGPDQPSLTSPSDLLRKLSSIHHARSPKEVRGPGFAPEASLSDPRTSPGDADSLQA